MVEEQELLPPSFGTSFVMATPPRPRGRKSPTVTKGRNPVKTPTTLLVLTLAVLLTGNPAPAEFGSRPSPADAPSPPSATPRVRPRAVIRDGFPLRFVENRGQVDPRVAYYLPGRERSLFFGREGVTVSLATGWALRLEFPGAAPVAPVARDRKPTVFSWFRGGRGATRAGVPTFGSLVYPDLWPGIDLVYSGTDLRMKYEFVVRPGADPSRIRLRWTGATSVTVDGDGRLVVETPRGGFHDDRPVSWQDGEDGLREVATAFRTGPGDGSFGFTLGDYDPSRTLVLDPAVVVRTGFLGAGSGEEKGEDIAVDGAGNAYVVGTSSDAASHFPVRTGPFTVHQGGENDAFIAKIDADGTDLVYAGFIGGDDYDRGMAVAVDGAGNAYVAGSTFSTEGTFPVAGGPDLTANGSMDAFVAKVNPAGTALLYCGFIGGAGSEDATGIGVDGGGRVCITGYVDSSEATFPVVAGPSLTYSGNGDAYVARVAADGSGLEYCGYVGGADSDSGADIAVDGTGRAWITGNTRSGEATFPVAVGPDLTYNGGGSGDAFVAAVNDMGTALVYCGYIGGSLADRGKGIAVDGGGVAWVTGYTDSTAATFPVAGGPALVNGGNTDAFVARVAANGSALLSCGYIGGTGYDYGESIALDGAGNGRVVGSTDSDAPSFPVIGGPGLTRSGEYDGFLATVLAADGSLGACGFFGGTGHEFPGGIAVDGAGDSYVTGYTASDGDSFPAPAGSNLGFTAVESSFVAKVGPAAAPAGPVASFILPKKVKAKLNAANPAKGSLVVAGFLDTGPAGDPDLDAGATVAVGTLEVEIPGLGADASGTKFTHLGEGLSLLVKTSKAGSSRAKFRLKFRGDLEESVDPEGFLTLGFDNGTVAGTGRVGLTGGAYVLGRKPGALLEPNLYLAKAKAVLRGEGKDSPAMTVGLATDGVAPETAPDVALGFGGDWALDVAGTSFLRSGDRLTATVEGATVVLDYARGTLTLKAKGTTLGTFPEGGQAVVITLALGDDAREVQVRMARKGAKLVY